MTTKMDERIARLEALIERIDALVPATTGPAPSPASVNPNGTPGLVAPGELIESAWGNATSNSITKLFTYPVIRLFARTQLTTDAVGQVAVGTGFATNMAIAVGHAQTAPFIIWMTTSVDATQAIFKAVNAENGVPIASAPVGITYIILGAP